MKIFGGEKRNRRTSGTGDRDIQRRRREQIEQTREQAYLQNLSSMFEKGIPMHRGVVTPEERPQPSGPPPAPEVKESPEQPLEPASSSGQDPFIHLTGGEASAMGDFSFGDIVLLGDSTIAIYSRFIPDKEYDVVYVIQPDGRLAPKGIPLAAHGARTIGRLPASATRRCCEEEKWQRDLMVFHLYEYEDTIRIPFPEPAGGGERIGPPPKAHHASETPETVHRSPLVRGRRFTVNFGDRAWEAVHWGHDEQGALVAHNTSGEWALMHLDLSRFEGSIQFHEILQGEKLAEVERGLMQNGEG